MYILSGWWFQIFFKIFHNIWDNPSHWLIFFRGVGQPPTSYCIACVEAYQQFQLGAKFHALSCPQIWILNGWFQQFVDVKIGRTWFFGGIDLFSFICFGSLGFRHGHLQAILSSQDLLHNRSMSIYMVSQPLFGVGLRFSTVCERWILGRAGWPSDFFRAVK